MTTYHSINLNGSSWRVSLHPAGVRPDGEDGGAEAICMVDDIQTVIVRYKNGRLNTPGDLSKEGEGSEDTVRRAVTGIVQADVIEMVPLGYAQTECVAGDNRGQITVRSMYVASVRLRPWNATQDDILERVVIPLDDLSSTMSRDWPGLDAFGEELVAMARVGSMALSTYGHD